MSLNDWSTTAGHEIADALAVLLGISTPDQTWLTFAVQARRETAGGTQMAAANNPLNLRPISGGWPGQVGTSPANFATFGSLEAGAWACARNYDNPPYQGVLDAFRQNDPVALAQAIESSPWDEGHYGYTLHEEVQAELGVPVDRQQYATDIEPLVKETIKIMVEQDGETRNAIAAIAQSVAPAADVSAVIKAVAEKLSA